MKYALSYKLTQEFYDDSKTLWLFTRSEVSDLMKTNYSKGFKAHDIVFDFGLQGEDFMKNIISMRIQYYLWKLPRFANPLRKKKRLNHKK